jgi:cytochrome c5
MHTGATFRRTAALAPALLLLAACAARAPREAPREEGSAAASLSAAEEAALAAAVPEGLPPGAGRRVLARHCTSCHNLGGLWAYQGYYDEPRWRGLVQTMIAHGAELNETETNELVAYLVEHFGPGTR